MIFLENVSDLNQPYSCEEWGSFGEENFPLLFTSPLAYPNYFYSLWYGIEGFNTAIILDHNLVFSEMIVATSTAAIGNVIQSLLDEIPISDFGDMNEDGIINIMDIIIIINIILNGNYMENADLNNDNIVNILDIITLANTILLF